MSRDASAHRPGTMRTERRLAALGSRAGSILLVIAAGILLGYLLVVTVGPRTVTDFENWLYGAAVDVLNGKSPYDPIGDAALAAGLGYVYPPLAAIVAVPLTVLPVGAAGIVVMVILALGVAMTLFVMGVRDLRCYAIAYVWPPVFSAIQTGNVTIPLCLAAAVAWRYRDRSSVTGAALGLSLAAKALLWPLVLWLVCTRRWMAAAVSAVVAVLGVLVSWAVIGFAGMGEYLELVRRLTALLAQESYSVYALALDVGISHGVAKALGVAVAVGLLATVVVLGRRGDDRRAFALAVVAALACSPLVWLHYFALLLVVVAVMQPRFGPAWFVPLAMFASTGTHNGTTLQTALTLAAAAGTAGLAIFSPALPRARVQGETAPP